LGGLAAGDFDHDGRLDIVTAGSNDDDRRATIARSS
jgi:hypothetical protein